MAFVNKCEECVFQAEPQLPTAVVIQPKDEDDKKGKEKSERDYKDECRHNFDRHFPSKTKLLELVVKRADKEKAEKEKLREEAAKGQPAVLSVSLGAPPPYTETKKDSILATGAPLPGATVVHSPSARRKTKSEEGGLSGTESIATARAALSPAVPKQQPSHSTSTVSSTQPVSTMTPSKTTAATLSSAQGRLAQPPPLSQLQPATMAPKAIPTQTSRSAAPSLPVPARPPTIAGSRYAQPAGRKRMTPIRRSPRSSKRAQPGALGALPKSSTSTSTAPQSITSTNDQTARQPTPGSGERKVGHQ
ncbi:hypothetical protein GCK32_014433 [Trichostrongylus colubriformis]|uniref:Uncharacterized protein n=1 Tax=Trichostrongylus colubriformis TaxID=6319 RepID=A0AAN8F1K3_TRICO